MTTAERFDDSRSRMNQGRAREADDGSEEPTPNSQSDQVELLRRAIRAVARAQRLVAETEDSRRRRQADRVERAADRDSRRSQRKDIEPDQAPMYQRAVLSASLERQLNSFVLAERSQGAPPELMLVRLKDIVRDTLNEDDRWRESPELREAIVRWAINAYFADG